MRRARVLVWVASLVFALAGSSAWANGRFPMADQLVVSPSDASFMVLRATFGLLISKDGGATWDWVCEQAIGYGGTQDPAIGVLERSAIIAGTFEGLSVSQDLACNWAFAPDGLANQFVVDVVVRPDAPHSALALVQREAVLDRGARLFGTTDGGRTWAPVGSALDPTIEIETVEVAASDPTRVYLSGSRGGEGPRQGVFLTSNDKGATWIEHAIDLDPMSERAPFIAAVDPMRADRVYVRTHGVASRLLVTDDGGESFDTAYAAVGQLRGFALSQDGSKVYIGGPLDGVLLAPAATLVFEKKSSVGARCLGISGTTLHACADETSGFVLGASEDDGATFTAKLHLWTVRGPLGCPASTSAAQCGDIWPAVRDTLGAGPDSEVPSPGESDAAPTGCSQKGREASWDAAALVLAVWTVMLTRRKRAVR